MLSHLVGREDKEKERTRGETTEDQREKGGCGMRACVRACMRVTVSLVHFYRDRLQGQQVRHR